MESAVNFQNETQTETRHVDSRDAAGALKGAFTRYVRALDPAREPGVAAFHDVLGALRAALAHELRKRSLWTRPPTASRTARRSTSKIRKPSGSCRFCRS